MAGQDFRMRGMLLAGSFPGLNTIQTVQRGYYKASWYTSRIHGCHKVETSTGMRGNTVPRATYDPLIPTPAGLISVFIFLIPISMPSWHTSASSCCQLS